LDSTILENLGSTLKIYPNLLIQYMSGRDNETVVLECWSQLLAIIGDRYREGDASSIMSLQLLVDGHESGALGVWLRPSSGMELKPVLDGLMKRTFNPEPDHLSAHLLVRILRQYGAHAFLTNRRL
jgi:hypothetical protein